MVKKFGIDEGMKKSEHSRFVFLPLTELFSEPFLRDLELIWNVR